MSSKWPSEQVEQLKQLCEQLPRLSVPDMARVMNVTVAAVQNQRHNLGLIKKGLERNASRAGHHVMPRGIGYGLVVVAEYALKPDALPVLWCGDYKSFTQLQEMLHADTHSSRA
jgi:hypothetical protein